MLVSGSTREPEVRADDDRPSRQVLVQPLVRLGTALRDAGYDFTTVTPRSHGIINARGGNERARTLRDVFGWSRPFAGDAALPAGLLDLMRDAEVLDRVGELYRSRIRLSTLNGELYIHSAYPTTATDAVFFGPDTYKFADAIALHLSRRTAPVRRAIDICCGAGPGALTIAKAASDAAVSMVDINPTALRYAGANAALAGHADLQACLGDMFEDVAGQFDLIVAHPPYLIDHRSRACRHGGGPLGAELALEIVRGALPRLSPDGTLLLFTGVAMVDGGDPFLSTVAPWLADSGLDVTYREVDADVFGEELEQPAYLGAERIALVVLEATRRGVPA